MNFTRIIRNSALMKSSPNADKSKSVNEPKSPNESYTSNRGGRKKGSYIPVYNSPTSSPNRTNAQTKKKLNVSIDSPESPTEENTAFDLNGGTNPGGLPKIVKGEKTAFDLNGGSNPGGLPKVVKGEKTAIDLNGGSNPEELPKVVKGEKTAIDLNGGSNPVELPKIVEKETTKLVSGCVDFDKEIEKITAEFDQQCIKVANGKEAESNQQKNQEIISTEIISTNTNEETVAIPEVNALVSPNRSGITEEDLHTAFRVIKHFAKLESPVFLRMGAEKIVAQGAIAEESSPVSAHVLPTTETLEETEENVPNGPTTTCDQTCNGETPKRDDFVETAPSDSKDPETAGRFEENQTDFTDGTKKCFAMDGEITEQDRALIDKCTVWKAAVPERQELKFIVEDLSGKRLMEATIDEAPFEGNDIVYTLDVAAKNRTSADLKEFGNLLNLTMGSVLFLSVALYMFY